MLPAVGDSRAANDRFMVPRPWLRRAMIRQHLKFPAPGKCWIPPVWQCQWLLVRADPMHTMTVSAYEMWPKADAENQVSRIYYHRCKPPACQPKHDRRCRWEATKWSVSQQAASSRSQPSAPSCATPSWSGLAGIPSPSAKSERAGAPLAARLLREAHGKQRSECSLT